MTDANLVRVLQAQCRAPVGLIDGIDRGGRGARPCARASPRCRPRAWAWPSSTLSTTTTCCVLAAGGAEGLPLVVAGSGLAIGLPAQLRPAPSPTASGGCRRRAAAARWSRAAARRPRARRWHGLSGPRRPALAIDPLRLAAGARCGGRGAGLGRRRLGRRPVLVYATADASAVQAVQGQLGVERPARWWSRRWPPLRAGLVAAGVRQLVVAGGETSGACVQALGVHRQMRSARRSTPACPGATRRTGTGRGPAPGAEVRQLRHRRLLHPSLHNPA
jgi:uncharacterized protein YgbK (DUF1537 family)